MPDKNEFETDDSNLTQDQMFFGLINNDLDKVISENIQDIMLMAEFHKLKHQDFEDDMFYIEPAKFDDFLAEVIRTYFSYPELGFIDYKFTSDEVRFQVNTTIIKSILKHKGQF